VQSPETATPSDHHDATLYTKAEASVLTLTIMENGQMQNIRFSF